MNMSGLKPEESFYNVDFSVIEKIKRELKEKLEKSDIDISEESCQDFI